MRVIVESVFFIIRIVDGVFLNQKGTFRGIFF